ncbi:MAG: isopentenyl-diphosphate Delta-isomerase [Bacteroidota bacterium]|jgi:isopentenyl-diphosphate delta-isomerase
MLQEVILVNENDEEIGVMEKIAAHEKALLHRAFSIFLFNSDGLMLLQKRAASKYHSPGLWTNACCSHPMPGESTYDAAVRRLKEELGFTTTLEKAFHFTYTAPFDNGLTEHEFDHVYIGQYNGSIHPDKNEVETYRYLSLSEIENEISSHPASFTPWFLIAFPLLKEWMHQNHTTYA